MTRDPRQCPQCHQRDGYHKMGCSDPSNVARGQRVTYTGHVSGHELLGGRPGSAVESCGCEWSNVVPRGDDWIAIGVRFGDDDKAGALWIKVCGLHKRYGDYRELLGYESGSSE